MNTRHYKLRRLTLVRLVPLALLCAALLASALGQPARVTAQVPAPFEIVKDFGDTLYPGSSLFTGGALSFDGAVVAGSLAYFQAYTPDTGSEIWRSDGTEAGTFMLKDICPGEGDQFPAPTFTALGTTIFFQADDCASGTELWKSDGTPTGTQRVKDINPGPNRSSPEDLFIAGGKLFFSAYDGATTRIWKSDGTEAGTTSTGASGTPIFALGNGIFFTTFTGGTCTIKRLDAASNAVGDVAPLCPRGIYGNGDGTSIAAGTTLAYFTAGDTSTGTEIWRTDGTPAGTFLLKDIRTGAETSMASNFLVNSLSQLIFSASDGTNGQELWKTDGTTANTSMIKDINPGAGSSDPRQIKLWNNILFFTAYDGTQTELWRSNGFSVDTFVVRDLTPPVGVSSNPSFLTPAANALFFVATDSTHTRALFKTDGTFSGTTLVKDPSTNVGSDDVYAPVAFGAGIFFLGDDGTHGGEPWFSDGTDAGTHMIKDIAGGENAGSQPIYLTALNGQALYFGLNLSGAAPNDFYALYRSDGSAAGTQPIRTFRSAPASEFDFDRAPVVFNGALYFAADGSSGVSGVELWRSDGTSAGTTILIDLNPGPSSGDPRWLTPSGQTLFCRAGNSANGQELWKTNGTPETTALVKDIYPGSNSGYPEYITPDGAGGIYFSAGDATAGTELWHSDGTSANTTRVLDIWPGSSGSSPQSLTLVGSNLFFTAQDPANGRELWVTDGTPEGTRRVRDITPGTSGTNFSPSSLAFAVRGGRVFFVASSDLFGDELWSSDGTESGTAIVKDVYPGAEYSDIQDLTVMNGVVYFVATGDDGKRTLWRSDGTTAGTARVISGANAPANPEALRVIDSLLYFSAADLPTVAGRELWVSDGTAAGTRRLQDLNPGATNSNPRGMVHAGSRIYLSAYKPGAGMELWSAQTQRFVYLALTRR